jgi:hypothetical protein
MFGFETPIVADPGNEFTVDLTIDQVTNPFAYSINLNIIPLEGQDPASLFMIDAFDHLLEKYNPGNVFSFATPSINNFSATVLGLGNSVVATNEKVASFKFSSTLAARGFYQIEAILATSLFIDTSFNFQTIDSQTPSQVFQTPLHGSVVYGLGTLLCFGFGYLMIILYRRLRLITCIAKVK